MKRLQKKPSEREKLYIMESIEEKERKPQIIRIRGRYALIKKSTYDGLMEYLDGIPGVVRLERFQAFDRDEGIYSLDDFFHAENCTIHIGYREDFDERYHEEIVLIDVIGVTEKRESLYEALESLVIKDAGYKTSESGRFYNE